MILEWQSNVAGFAGAHAYWWPGQFLFEQDRISIFSETPVVVQVGDLTTTAQIPSPVSADMILIPPTEHQALVDMTKAAVLGGLKEFKRK